MTRHTPHLIVGYSPSVRPNPTEREYLHASFEISAIPDYSPINHCFYLLLLTFIDILENPVSALGPGPTAKMRHVSPQKSGQVSMHQQDRDDRGSIFWYKSHFVSKCLTEEVRAPNFAKFAGCPAAKYRGKHTLPRALRHKLSPKSNSNGSGDDRGREENVNISQHFTTFSRNLYAPLARRRKTQRIPTVSQGRGPWSATNRWLRSDTSGGSTHLIP